MYIYSETTVEFERTIDKTRQQFMNVFMCTGREGKRISLNYASGVSCLLMIEEGECSVMLEHAFMLRKEDVIYIPSDKMAEAFVEFTTWSKIYLLYYRRIDQEGMTLDETLDFGRIPNDLCIDGLFSLVQILIRENRQKEKNWQPICDSVTDIIFMRLWRNTAVSSQKFDTQTEQPADAVRKYIEQNYMKRITLSSIAKALYISESTVSHNFQAKFKQSVARYLQNFRIEKSKELLNKTTNGISEIGNEVGFSSLATYYRNFKQQEGISPAQYREKHQSTSAANPSSVQSTKSLRND